MSCTKLIVTAGGLPPSKKEYVMCKFPGVARAAAKVNVYIQICRWVFETYKNIKMY